MAPARRNQRLRYSYDTDKIPNARIAETVVMDISPHRDAASPRYFSLAGLLINFSHNRS
jgi:hypothetical protein